MSIQINSPLPMSLASECRKAARILNSFTDNGKGVDIIIPPHILANAKGLAILTVLKAGFLFSGRAGSGIVVARLPNGKWSAPSAIMTGGMGFGGQVGAELTDFIMVLNTSAAVKTFMHHGSITLGGNISVALGPVGRNAEASGTASLKSVSAVYSYSKTRGVFAGVSLEGSVIIERFDANKKMYGGKVATRDLLNGTVPPPAAADNLYKALELKSGSSGRRSGADGYMYSSQEDDEFGRYDGSSHSGAGTPNSYQYNNNNSSHYNSHEEEGTGNSNSALHSTKSFSRAAVHNLAKSGGVLSSHSPTEWRKRDYTDNDSAVTNSSRRQIMDTGYYNNDSNNGSHSRDMVTTGSTHNYEQTARALFKFTGEQNGDLAFHKGDTITIVKKTGTQNDWWTGKIGSRQGIFPANFVELI